MSENINNQDLLGSGGHQWSWGDPAQMDKVLRTVGLRGAGRFVTNNGPRPLTIAGRERGPAVLRGSGANRAAADAALTALEAALESLIRSGAEAPWEDDCGHTGTRLALTRYRRQGPRIYPAGGTQAWQRYILEGLELDGGF